VAPGIIESVHLVGILVVEVVREVLARMPLPSPAASAQADQEFHIRLLEVMLLIVLVKVVMEELLEYMVLAQQQVLSSFVIQHKKEKKYDYYRHNRSDTNSRIYLG
jgi:hypothetical protein